MSSLYVNGETGQVGIGTSDPSNLLHVEVNGNTPGNVEIMTRIENVEFPPVATSNVGFVADYGDMVASIDSISNGIVEFPPPTYPFTANSMTITGATYGNGAYVASVSSRDSDITYDGWKVFNKTTTNSSDAWVTGSTTYSGTTGVAISGTTTVSGTTRTGSWVQLQVPSSIIISFYQLAPRTTQLSTAPSSWCFAGSLDGITWNLIDERSGNLQSTWIEKAYLTFNAAGNVTPYSYYRLIITSLVNNGSQGTLGEFKLFANVLLPIIREYPPAGLTDYSSYQLSHYGAGYYNVSSSTIWGTENSIWQAFDKLQGNIAAVSGSTYTANVAYSGTVRTLSIANVSYSGEWIQIKLPNPIILRSYSITPQAGPANVPLTFYILASTNGSNGSWIELDSKVVTWPNINTQYWTITPYNSMFSYFRIICNISNATTFSLGDWRLYGDATSSYPKYKCALPASSTTVTNGSTYGAGTYSVYANTISNWTFSNQTTPSALVDKNTLVGWQSSSNIYTNLTDAPALATPSIYFQLPDVITLTGYTLSARSATLTEVPTKWNLYGSNLSSVGAGWSTLDSRTAATTQVATPQSFTPLNVTAPYNLFRFDLLQNASSTPAPISLAELKLTGSKPTSERRLVIASDGRVGINTSVAGLNNDAALTVAGDLAVTDIYVTGIIGDPILQTGPYVAFDGSAANRDKFLAWMQYVTSARYRYNFGPTVLKNSWWNVGTNVDLYDTYTYSTVAGKSGTANYWYYGGVTIPGKKVVFVPHNASTVLVFNALTNSFVEYATTLAGGNNYWGGALTYDNRVVFAPRAAASVGIFNPVTNTFSSVGIPAVGSTADRYYGAIATPDKRIIFVPASATTVGVFDPQTEIFTTYGSLPATTSKYSGGVLLPNNKIVFVPNTSTSIGIFDIATNTYSTITPVSPALPGANTFNGGVLMKNGHVLFIPTSVTYFGVFNPFSNTYYTISPANSPTIGYITGLLLSDGRVFLCPYSASTFGFFNPDDNTYTSLAGAPSGGAYIGANLLVDGRIILTQAQTTTIGILTPTQLTRSPPPELVYHPCFNKF